MYLLKAKIRAHFLNEDEIKTPDHLASVDSALICFVENHLRMSFNL